MPADYVIVGAGLFGVTFARNVAEQGHTVVLVDKRSHIGGNCYTEDRGGIHVHVYGPHIFHTDDPEIWQFVQRFAKFNHYRHRGCVHYKGRIFSFPINLHTLHQLWGVTTPAEAERKLAEVRIPCANPRNLEQWILSQVGRELYEIFIHGYTSKQWNCDPKELPSSIIRRIPIRLTYDDRYFNDRFQGIPIGGYTGMIMNMLDHPNIRFETGVDYFENQREVKTLGRTLVYTGKVDEFFDYRYGRLEYRSLRFEQEEHAGDYQGVSIANYTDPEVPHTRITEHKHFEFGNQSHTVITREFPEQYDETKTPYYPIRDEANSKVYDRYRMLAQTSNVIFGGRLGTYQYFDMHQVIAQALVASNKARLAA
jgi:UDP-galactopyranose mutase